MTFRPFHRLRPRSNTVPVPVPSSEEDSDASSPERDHHPHIIHISPKSASKSGERTASFPGPHGAPDKFTEPTRITFMLHGTPHASHPEQPSKKPGRPNIAAVTHPNDSPHALRPSKSTLIRRVTSKLTISIPSRSNTQGLQSRPSTRTLPAELAPPLLAPRSPRTTVPAAPLLPNGFISKEHREAALRERGLLPPRKDLSQQEREADERLGHVPSPVAITSRGLSEAERLKANWLATNRSSESSDSDSGPPVPPHLEPANRSPSMLPSPTWTVSPPDVDVHPMNRHLLCSAAPLLSPPSHLEVLHEEPCEQTPIVSPPPLIVSTTHEHACPPSPVTVESPTSCTFSSRCAGSNSSQHDHLSIPDKENVCSTARRRTSGSVDRGRKLVGSSLSRLGSRSLSNLRRSMTDSWRMPSPSVHSAGDTPSLTIQAPRTAVSPTIHSMASILRETGGIQDVESRRLSELAFLD